MLEVKRTTSPINRPVISTPSCHVALTGGTSFGRGVGRGTDDLIRALLGGGVGRLNICHWLGFFAKNFHELPRRLEFIARKRPLVFGRIWTRDLGIDGEWHQGENREFQQKPIHWLIHSRHV